MDKVGFFLRRNRENKRITRRAQNTYKNFSVAHFTGERIANGKRHARKIDETFIARFMGHAHRRSQFGGIFLMAGAEPGVAVVIVGIGLSSKKASSKNSFHIL